MPDAQLEVDSSHPRRVLDPRMGSQWVSAKITNLRTPQIASLTFPITGSLRRDTIAVMGIRVRGETVGTGRNAYQVSMAAAPTITVYGEAVTMRPVSYPVRNYASLNRNAAVVFYEGSISVKQTAHTFTDQNMIVPIVVNAAQNYHIQIARVVIGSRYEFPTNFRQNMTLTIQDPSIDASGPGEDFQGDWQPPYKRAQVTFQNVEKGQVDSLAQYYRLHAAVNPVVLQLDEDNVDGLIYGRIRSPMLDSWNFKDNADEFHTVNMTIEETNRSGVR